MYKYIYIYKINLHSTVSNLPYSIYIIHQLTYIHSPNKTLTNYILLSPKIHNNSTHHHLPTIHPLPRASQYLPPDVSAHYLTISHTSPYLRDQTMA